MGLAFTHSVLAPILDKSSDLTGLGLSTSISPVQTTISGATSEARSVEVCRDCADDMTSGVAGGDIRS